MREVIYLISTAFAHVDESQFVVETPLSDALVELLLSTVVDSNDSFLILTVSATRTWNCSLKWVEGAQRSPQEALKARPILQQLRMKAVQLRRYRA